MAYLVDTDIVLDLTRGSHDAADYLDSLRGEWSISGITSLELISGARNAREVADIDIIISAYHAINPNDDIIRRAYYLLKTYAKSHGLHSFDAIIAATALEESFTLATKNRKHFSMIRDLDLEVPSY